MEPVESELYWLKPVDTLAHVVWQLLGFLPPGPRTLFWFPALVAVLMAGTLVFTRKLLPLCGRAGELLLRFAVAVLGAAVFLPEAAIAQAFRWARVRPPSVLYSYGDAVAGSLVGLSSAAPLATAGAAKVARVHVIVVLLAAGAWLWWWNDNQCGEEDIACVPPVASWLDGFGDGGPGG